jgi:hypothetical protein
MSVPVQGEELIEGGDAVQVDDAGRRGMPANNPRVRSLIAAHPSQLAVICVAGCDGKAKIVQLLPKPVTARLGAYQPSAGTQDDAGFAAPAPRTSVGEAPKNVDAVVCLAGCDGRPGQVLQRVNLPPKPPRRLPPQSGELPPLPAESAPSEPAANEPLDVGR